MDDVKALERRAFELLQLQRHEQARDAARNGLKLLADLLSGARPAQVSVRAFYLRYTLATALVRLGQDVEAVDVCVRRAAAAAAVRA